MRYKLILSFAISLLIASNVSAQFSLENAFPNLSFNDPLDLQNSGDGTDRIFVVERAGRIKVFPNSSTVTSLKTYLDITDRVSGGGEMGLLGLAFHPDYENNGYFYVNYTVSNPRKTRISRFKVSSENPDSADKNSELILLTFNQPFSNHNGGWIGFGPDDGYLYIGTGDGGSGGDPQNNGQSIVTFLGKILRIDIDNQDPGLEYAIPLDNPFADSTGSIVKEIYAWGLRNPWRSSFDPVTGWLWSADVGQNAWEEIDIIENGKNYGWRCYEGNHPFNLSGCDFPEYIFPIWEYSHGLGCSVTGGYVYRGPTVPELTGKYIYADYCTRTVWSLEYDGINPPDNQTLLTAPANVTSFGLDENNELYVVTFNPDRIYRFSPTIPLIAPTNLVATATGPNEVELNWVDNSNDEETFHIERKLGDSISTNEYSEIATVSANVTTYVDNTVGDTTMYTYRVRGKAPWGTYSSYSNEAEVLTLIPVELTSFEGMIVDGNVKLIWATATETNNYGFDVERKNPPLNPLQGGDFEKIGFVQGHGTTTESQSYFFTDESILSGTYQYRLKQVDYDGSYEYSNIIEVEVGIPTEFSLEQNYPNPFNPTTIIKFTISDLRFTILKIYDVLGNEVATLINEEKEAGIYEVEFDATNITSGIYFYRLTAGDPSTSSGQSFTATKKMIILK